MVSAIKASENWLHLSFSEIDFVATKKNNLWNINLSKFQISQKVVVCKVSVQSVDVHSNVQETGMQFG